MKNKITLFGAILLLLTVGFGCSLVDRVMPSGNSSTNSGTSNTSTNSANPNDAAKTGVAECDEFIDLLNRDKSDPNDDMFTRKIKEYAIDLAKESIKKNIDENQRDKERIAQNCKLARDEYIRNKEKNDQNQNGAGGGGNTQKP